MLTIHTAGTMPTGQHKGQDMDIDEFEKQMQPSAKRSKLEPFQAQIFELKSKGYANWQVCEWLVTNGVKVSQEGLRKFIKSRESTHTATQPAAKSESPPPAAPLTVETEKDEPPSPTEGTKAKAERKASKYLGGNPLDFNVDNLLNPKEQK